MPGTVVSTAVPYPEVMVVRATTIELVAATVSSMVIGKTGLVLNSGTNNSVVLTRRVWTKVTVSLTTKEDPKMTVV